MGGASDKRVGIYLRVSTGLQTTENQRRDLEEVAERAGWNVVGIYEDAGISGAKGRAQRPAFDELLKDATRRKVNMIAAWSLDRLGRSIKDLVAMLEEIRKVGCDLYLHRQAIDTSTGQGRLFFNIVASFGEYEREMIKDRVNSGLFRARQDGKRLGRPTLGSPQSVKRNNSRKRDTSEKAVKALRDEQKDKERKVRDLRAQGTGILRTSKLVGVGVGTVYRIDAEMKAEAAQSASPP